MPIFVSNSFSGVAAAAAFKRPFSDSNAPFRKQLQDFKQKLKTTFPIRPRFKIVLQSQATRVTSLG
jgi:hypothetical protein